MAYENLEFSYSNFCIGAQNGTFCSIDTTNPSAILQVKNSSGDVIRNYTLDPNISQGTEIKAIEYPGPRGLSNFYDGLPFFTLEHDNDTQCTIKKWNLDHTNTVLNLDYSIVKTTSTGIACYNCNAMALEYYHTEFDGATTTGTGKIKIDSYSNINTGDVLFLGPSTDVDNLNAFEYVNVATISGGWVYITASGIVPPVYEYKDEDQITYSKNIFLFSDLDKDGNTNKGSLYKLDTVSGTLLDVQNDGIYAGVNAAAWSLDYQGIGFVNGVNLLYIDPNNNYQVQKSHALTNINADEVTVLPVYDLIFDNTSIYRLQDKITLRDNDGDKATYDWSTYNYHQDAISPYTFSTTIFVDLAGVALNQGEVTLTAVVRDQFGVGLLNKLLYFSKSGDSGGYFTPINGQVYTNASGIATILYTCGWYNLEAAYEGEEIDISARTDGGSTLLGGDGYSGYIWGDASVWLHNKFDSEFAMLKQVVTLSGVWPTSGPLYTEKYIRQLTASGTMDTYLITRSKFQFPGGHWHYDVGMGIDEPPVDYTTIIRQLQQPFLNQISGISLQVIPPEITIAQLDALYQRYYGDDDYPELVTLKQVDDFSNEFQLSQTYISRHLSLGHKDDVDVDQFKFIEDAIPAFWSEKNSVGTNIWIRLRPFAFSLNQSTLIFRVKEVSYAGDTGYVDVTALCSVSTFDAGGGLLGLDILYNPPQNFHNNAIVFVSIEVYDTAPVPNILLTDYWFRVIPDYKAPYIVNEVPNREEENVSIDTNIEFDVLDLSTGVDISTLEMYVNNKYVSTCTVSGIVNGYHICYSPSENFSYSETVSVYISVGDISDNVNILRDMWRFYCKESSGPWFDHSSFFPPNCAKGVYRKYYPIQFNVYGLDDGIERESIIVSIGGKYRNVSITPIIYRLE